jgi:hypothetical protein
VLILFYLGDRVWISVVYNYSDPFSVWLNVHLYRNPPQQVALLFGSAVHLWLPLLALARPLLRAVPGEHATGFDIGQIGIARGCEGLSVQVLMFLLKRVIPVPDRVEQFLSPLACRLRHPW